MQINLLSDVKITGVYLWHGDLVDAKGTVIASVNGASTVHADAPIMFVFRGDKIYESHRSEPYRLTNVMRFSFAANP